MGKTKVLTRLFAVGLMAVATALCRPSPASSEEVLRVGGSGGAIGTIKRLASVYSKSHPGIRFEIMPSLGSGGAIKALSKDVLDIGLIARPLKDSEERLSLQVREYAVTPLVLATSTTCPMTDISTEELLKVYRGEMRRWPCGKRVRLVLRPAGDSDTMVIRGISPALGEAIDEALARPGMFVALTDQEAADVLGRSPERFGTSTLALIVAENRPLRALSFNGVAPTLQALVDGSYPLSKTYSFVTTRSLPQHGAAFIDFVFSPEGRKVLEESGNLPADAVSRI